MAMHNVAIAVATTLLLISSCCLAQESIADDNNTWNAFFRDMKAEPPFPYPGTMNFPDWEQYKYGFKERIWDTKDFASLVLLGTRTGHYEEFLWENFWAYFDIYLMHEMKYAWLEDKFQWNTLGIQDLWTQYIKLMKELYCCPNAAISLGQQAFSCKGTNVTYTTICCQSGIGVHTCDNLGLSIVKQWSAHSIQTMKFKFYVWLCTVYISKPELNTKAKKGTKSTGYFTVMEACPNPCHDQPCNDLENAIAGSCKRLSGHMGYYRGGYTCKCRPSYVFDGFSHQCQLKSLCDMGACNSTNTHECEDLDTGYKCKCFSSSSGSTCSSPMNPCLHRLHSNEVSGNVACRTPNGNRCLSGAAVNIFKCECIKPYTRETDIEKLKRVFRGKELPPDNCQSTVDVCSYVNCNSTGHGRCMPSGDLRTFICICDKDADGYPLYEGDYCELAISSWLPWSQWGGCRPECGSSCYQSRQRPCQHLEGQRYCKGTDEELRPCEPACQPCPNRSFVYLSGVFIKETAGSVVLALAALFLVQMAAMALVEWLLSRDVFLAS